MVHVIFVCVFLTLSYVDVILSSYNSHEPDEYDVFRQTMKVTVSLQPLGGFLFCSFPLLFPNLT